MSQFADTEYDMIVVGGGVNGCGIARDAAGRGLKILLVEQGDLAQGTSSASTKLIHGGLRYLEYYEFLMVRSALTEREVLLDNAPHIISPLRFVLPHHKELRPAWFLRLGLFMYDHLGGRKRLAGTKTLNLQKDPLGAPLNKIFRKGFEYSDCWVDDARLVLLNALDASHLGADVHTRTTCIGAERENGVWQVKLQSGDDVAKHTVRGKILINAAGPWVDEIINRVDSSVAQQKNVRLVRGSHVVVPKLYDHDRAYIFQNRDGRIIFTIPYENGFTLLGTTDLDQDSMEAEIQIRDEEVEYICNAVGEYFSKPVKSEDVIWTYSGVRPLYDDGASAAQEATRDYVLRLDEAEGQAPLLNIFGGKITTYRKLAEKVLLKLKDYLPANQDTWTATTALPGGDFAVEALDELIAKLQKDYSFIDKNWARSLIRRYGTRAWNMLGDATASTDLGIDFGATLTEREVRFLQREEWAVSAEDILWRRSKLGLHMTQEQRQQLSSWLEKTTERSESAA